MAKVTLTDVTSGYAAKETTNANNDAIETWSDSVLSRDGTTPNSMQASLDMNQNRIINLPDAVNNSEPLTLGQAATLSQLTGITATAGAVGEVLWPQTSAESAAGVTPTNYQHPPGDVRRYSLNADGSADDAGQLNKIFEANRHVIFPEKETFAFESALTIPADTIIQFRESTLKLTATINSPSTAITVGSRCQLLSKLNIEVPSGVICDRAIKFADDCNVDYIEIESVDQQNNRDANLDGALVVDGDFGIIKRAHVKNFDNAFVFDEGSDNHAIRLTFESYVRGIWSNTNTRLRIDSWACHTKSANGTTDPGHNGLLATSPNFCHYGDCICNDAGEHGIRVGGTVASRSNTFGICHINRPGQTGFKILGDRVITHEDIVIGALFVTDCSFGGSSTSNEDGLRAQYVTGLTVGAFSVKRNQNAGTSCYDGIHLENCSQVNINSPYIFDANNDGIHITDNSTAVTIEKIHINSPYIDTVGNNGITLDADTAGSAVRNIHIPNVYINDASNYAVYLDSGTAIVTQPIVINGKVNAVGTGVQSFTFDDEKTNVRLVGAEDRETGAGTFTCSVIIRESVLDSTGGAVTATLPDGLYDGQRKVISFTGSTSSTLSVTSHETSDPEVFTFAQSTDFLVLEWSRKSAFWWTVKNVGVST